MMGMDMNMILAPKVVAVKKERVEEASISALEHETPAT